MGEGCWILQTHRDQFDPDQTFPEVGDEDRWAGWNREGESIGRGCKVALYAMGGKRKGIFAFGEVVSGPEPLSQSDKFGSPAAVTERPGFQAEFVVSVRYDRILLQPITHAALSAHFGRTFWIVRNVQRLNYEISHHEWEELDAMSETS